MNHRKLSELIATEILSVYDRSGATECTRAQMMLARPDGTERNMGGRNKDSIIEAVDYILRTRAEDCA